MNGWSIPSRGSILPASADQSCAVCGSRDWSWFYLLLRAPEWVQRRGWFANWFMVLCDDCHVEWERGLEGPLRNRWESNAEPLGRPSFEEYREVVLAMQSEPPLTRAAAIGT